MATPFYNYDETSSRPTTFEHEKDPVAWAERSHYLNQDKEAAWETYLQQLNPAYVNGTDAKSKYVRAQKDQYYDKYKANAARNVSLGFWDYLNAIYHNNTPENKAKYKAEKESGHWGALADMPDPEGIYSWDDPDQNYDYLSPQQRGDFTSALVAPRGRWVSPS